MRDEAASSLALGALVITLLAFYPLLMLLTSSWPGDVVGPYLAAVGILLGHAARSRARRQPVPKRGHRLATWAVGTGHAWFGLLFLWSLQFGFYPEIPAMAASIEVSRLLVRKALRNFRAGLVLTIVLGGITWYLLDRLLGEFHSRNFRDVIEPLDFLGFYYPFAFLGIIVLTVLPAAVCFGRGSRHTGTRRVVLAGAMYILAAGNIWNAWGEWSNYAGHKKARYLARVMREQRVIAVNLETYYLDHMTYPPAVDANGRVVPFADESPPISAGYVPWLLTTPIAYTSSLPYDPYHKRPDGTYLPYRYAANGTGCWIMVSPGPDGDVDIRIEEFPDPGKGACNWVTFMSHFGTGTAVQYDSTNGSVSSGDIVRVGP